MPPEHTSLLPTPDNDFLTLLYSQSEQGPWVGRETQFWLCNKEGLSPRFGSGRPTSFQICQSVNNQTFCSLALRSSTHFLNYFSSRAAKTSSLSCWFIHDFECSHHSRKTKPKTSVDLKSKLVEDNLIIIPTVFYKPQSKLLILYSLNFSIGRPQTRVEPLQRSENQCLVDYGYSCMIPGQNMPSCKSFLCIVRAQ